MNAQKAMHAAVGAPVVAGRRLNDLKDKMIQQSRRLQSAMTDGARKEFDLMVEEGERTAAKLKEQKVVEELQSRVDFEQITGQVTKLRDQLEAALGSWKETFRPAKTAPDAEKAADKPAAKKTTAAKPAAKKAAAKKPAAKKSAAKKAAAKSAAKEPAAKS